MQTHLSPISGDESLSFFWYKRGGTFTHANFLSKWETSALLIGREREDRELLLCLLFLNCLQLKIINMRKEHILGWCVPIPFSFLGISLQCVLFSGGQFMASTVWIIANCQDGDHQLSKPVIPENASRSPSGLTKLSIILSHWDPRHRAP